MTTIAYDQPIEDLIAALDATGHITHSRWIKTSVTFHHNGGRLSHQGVLNVWKVRPASAHFDSDAFGRLAQYAEVHEYAWSTGNTQGNISSISIEMCDQTLSPTWDVAEVTWKSAARLAGWLFANVIHAAPTASNVLFHHDWLATECAGPYMDSVRAQLLAEVQAAYAAFTNPITPPKPTPTPPTPPAPPKPATYYVGATVQRAWARQLGTTADGVISSQDSGQKSCFQVDLWPCVEWAATGSAHGSSLINAFQRAHGLHPDGLVGPATMRAIQSWAGLRGSDVDGVGGPRTTAALCKKLGY